MWEVVIDSNRCLGCACCVDIAPSMFIIGPEGYPKYVGFNEVTGTDFGTPLETIKVAVLTCPVKAIDVRI